MLCWVGQVVTFFFLDLLHQARAVGAVDAFVAQATACNMV